MSNFTVPHNTMRTQIEGRGPREDVQVEFVTDTILQVVINIDTREKRVLNAAWSFCEALERAGFVIEGDTGSPAASLFRAFDAAWFMTQAQKIAKRRKAHNALRA